MMHGLSRCSSVFRALCGRFWCISLLTWSRPGLFFFFRFRIAHSSWRIVKMEFCSSFASSFCRTVLAFRITILSSFSFVEKPWHFQVDLSKERCFLFVRHCVSHFLAVRRCSFDCHWVVSFPSITSKLRRVRKRPVLTTISLHLFSQNYFFRFWLLLMFCYVSPFNLLGWSRWVLLRPFVLLRVCLFLARLLFSVQKGLLLPLRAPLVMFLFEAPRIFVTKFLFSSSWVLPSGVISARSSFNPFHLASL